MNGPLLQKISQMNGKDVQRETKFLSWFNTSIQCKGKILNAPMVILPALRTDIIGIQQKRICYLKKKLFCFPFTSNLFPSLPLSFYLTFISSISLSLCFYFFHTLSLSYSLFISLLIFLLSLFLLSWVLSQVLSYLPLSSILISLSLSLCSDK